MQEDYTVEKEIDLVEQIGRLWLCRRFIVLVALLFLVVGCVVALLLPKEYRAWCEVVPQTSSSTQISNLSSLAALAGINLARIEEEYSRPYWDCSIFCRPIDAVLLGDEFFYSIVVGQEEGVLPICL